MARGLSGDRLDEPLKLRWPAGSRGGADSQGAPNVSVSNDQRDQTVLLLKDRQPHFETASKAVAICGTQTVLPPDYEVRASSRLTASSILRIDCSTVSKTGGEPKIIATVLS